MLLKIIKTTTGVYLLGFRGGNVVCSLGNWNGDVVYAEEFDEASMVNLLKRLRLSGFGGLLLSRDLDEFIYPSSNVMM